METFTSDERVLLAPHFSNVDGPVFALVDLPETVYRLDLRDPENRAVAAPLLAAKWPWGARERAAIAAVGKRIAGHGTIERTVSSVSGDTRGISGSVRGGWKFGGGVKRIKVHRELVAASARVGGFERARQDCQASR